MGVSRSPRSAQLLQQRVGGLRRTLRGVRAGDVRSVHQARVATRRLRAALPLVEAGKAGRRLERMARELTRMLGPVRELDVARLMLDEFDRAADVPATAVDCLRRVIEHERWTLHRDAARWIDEVDIDRLQRKALRALERKPRVAKGPPDRQLQVAAARRRAARRAERLQGVVDAAGTMYLPDRLHQVRIAVKKLRYALEVVRDLSGSRAEARIRALKRLQDLLGRMHDLEVLIARTRALQSASVPDLQLSADLDQLVRRLETEARQLHAHYITLRRPLLDICTRVMAIVQSRRAA